MSTRILGVTGATALGGAGAYDVYSDWDLPPSGTHEPYADAIELSQLDPQLKTYMPCEGKMACGPTSATMGLSWFAEHGFEKLAPQVRDPDRNSLVSLAHSLSYGMRGYRADGVWDEEFGDGVIRTFTARGYPAPTISYSGWLDGRWPGNNRYAPEQLQPPDLNSALSQVREKKGMVWISVQWLQQSTSSDTEFDTTKKGRHLLLLTGYERRSRFGKDEITLLLRDPWNKNPETPAGTKRWKVREVEEGIFKNDDKEARPSAKGQFELTGDDGNRLLLRALIQMTPPKK